uniref:Uncharacterized protein n=1 Tax=Arundo donax TaxID=35708 RepID=A0A0A9EN75_ARUDO
MLWFVELF